MRKKPSLSLFLPCFNEENVIENSYRELRPLLESWLKDLISRYEIIMVNNGSTDETLSRMLDIKANDQNVKIINFIID
jgi:glycosyltransferase involved in cell wall biosynthesis